MCSDIVATRLSGYQVLAGVVNFVKSWFSEVFEWEGSNFIFESLLDRFGSLELISMRHQELGLEAHTSMNFSKSLSKSASLSFRFLLSAINPCFFFNRPCLCSSKARRSACSWSIRAIVKATSSASACSGCRARNSSTGTRGSCLYLLLDVY